VIKNFFLRSDSPLELKEWVTVVKALRGNAFHEGENVNGPTFETDISTLK